MNNKRVSGIYSSENAEVKPGQTVVTESMQCEAVLASVPLSVVGKKNVDWLTNAILFSQDESDKSSQSPTVADCDDLS